MPSSAHDWIKEFPGAVTVCDEAGVILSLNDRAAETFREDGGLALIGRNVLDCHPEPARSQLAEMLAAGRANVYTIEKNGVRKLIYQSPWYRDGRYAGFVELSLIIPEAMPHFNRTRPTA
jgi:PAS domain-containing protein